LARAAKATKRPSGVIDGGGAKAPERQGPFAWFPALSTLTRSVVPADAPAAGARSARAPARMRTAAPTRERVTHSVIAADDPDMGVVKIRPLRDARVFTDRNKGWAADRCSATKGVPSIMEGE